MILNCFGTFLDPFQGQKCLKMSLQNSFWALTWATSAQKRSKISLGPPKGPPGTPTAAQRPPGMDLGAFWAPFWGLLGCILEPPRGSILGAMLPYFLSFLASFHFFLPHSFVPLLPASPFFTPGSNDSKKPRTQATEKRSNPETRSNWVGGCPR